MKRVLGKNVLVEQTDVKKSTVLHLPDTVKKDDAYISTFKVLAVGTEIPKGEIEVGDIPVLGMNAVPRSVKVIESTKEKNVAHIIFYSEDIVAIEDEETLKKVK